MLLLDTHVLIWWLTDDKRLGRRAGSRIDRAWPDSLSICAASWYELSLVHTRGGARLDEFPTAMRIRLIGSGLNEIAIDGSAALDGAYLEGILDLPVFSGELFSPCGR